MSGSQADKQSQKGNITSVTGSFGLKNTPNVVTKMKKVEGGNPSQDNYSKRKSNQ